MASRHGMHFAVLRAAVRRDVVVIFFPDAMDLHILGIVVLNSAGNSGWALLSFAAVPAAAAVCCCAAVALRAPSFLVHDGVGRRCRCRRPCCCSGQLHLVPAG